MKTITKKNTSTNNSKAVKVSKKVVKTLTEQRKAKQAQKAKREANPQLSHLASAKKKEQRKDAKRVLLAAKQLINTVESELSNLYENEAQIRMGSKCINKVCKSESLMALVIEAHGVSKSGNFSEYRFAQVVQGMVRLAAKKAFDYPTALNYIIAARKVRLAAKLA